VTELKILVWRDCFGNIHYPLRGSDFFFFFFFCQRSWILGTITIKPRLLSFLQGDAGQGREAVPIVEDVRVYGRRYAAAFSLAA
jgi:hypothetical protein